MRKKDKELEAFANSECFTSARIWHCKYKSLEPISDLVNLTTLVIAAFPDTNLEFLTNLKSLKYLRILHLPKVTSVSALAKLTSIESLSLATLPSWDSSGKVTIIDSLNPISLISNLKHIELFGVHPESKKLSGLEACTSLKSGRFTKYPKTEIERFVSKMGITQDSVPEPEYAKL